MLRSPNPASSRIPHDVPFATHDRCLHPPDRTGPGRCRGLRPSPSTGSPFSATIIPSSSRSGRGRGCSWPTPPGRTPATTSSGSRSRGSTPGSRPSGWRSRGSPTPGSGPATPATSWRAGFRIGASARCTSISPTRGGRSGTRSVGSSPSLLVAQIERALEPGGELHVASDVEEYFAIDPRADRREPPVPRRGRSPSAKDPEHELDYLTNFERKYRLEGRAGDIGRHGQL